MEHPDTVSPEEKLLRVIRGDAKTSPRDPAENMSGDGATVDSADRSAIEAETSAPVPAPDQASGPAPTPVPVPAPAPVKAPESAKAPAPDQASGPAPAVKRAAPHPAALKLKQSRSAKAHGGAAAGTKPVATPASSSIAAGVEARRALPDWRRGLTVAAGGMFFVATLLTALSLWAAWGHAGGLRTEDLPEPPARAPDAMPPDAFDPDAAAATAVPLDDLIRRFRERPLFEDPYEIPPPGPEDDKSPRTRVGWEQYARNNLRLLGLSMADPDTRAMEAIVADSAAGTMHYLRQNDGLLLESVRVLVESIERDHLVLSDGIRRMELK